MNKKLKAEAFLFYGIVRSCGWYWWDSKHHDEVDCIGISWLWALPDTHPFQPAASAHDAWYEKHTWENGEPCTRAQADKAFLIRCLAIADEDEEKNKGKEIGS